MPKRIQMSRQHPWRADNPDAVIVARPSKWGNPFPIDRWGLETSLGLFKDSARGIWNPTRLEAASDADVTEAYTAATAWHRRLSGHPTEIAIAELTGRDLACWCPLDQPCHADVLLELANPSPSLPVDWNEA